MKFTPSQDSAITTTGRNVLVSAAAGSGKTAVLVERIIQRVLNESNPIDIDRILVVTFTKAAAGQMRDKIADALEAKAGKNPDDDHLARQLILVHNARISTFHSFCQEVIREHFYEIGAEPKMRVADETEVKLMKADAVEKVLEAAYGEGNESFFNLVENCATGKSDAIIEDTILQIFDLSMAQPDPDKWLDFCESTYDIKNAEDLRRQAWFEAYFGMLRQRAASYAAIASELIELCDLPNGPAKYKSALQADFATLNAMAECTDYDRFSFLTRSYTNEKLASITAKDSVDISLKERVAGTRRQLIVAINDLKKECGISLEQKCDELRTILPIASEFVRLVKEFAKEFAAIKEDAGVMDFNDMEHMAIRILKNPDGITAAEYRNHFEEIYIDEYQDSNFTQEAIIKLIARGDGENAGNVFMVGDVKQSIYRFRNARPDLFVSKYDSYGMADDTNRNARIDLSQNFRSRMEVLNSVNEIFKAVMVKNLGGIEYDDSASLHYGGLYGDEQKEEYRSELILIHEDENVSDTEMEVYTIADRIKELVGTAEVLDSKTGVMRKAKYSDIAILLRSMRGRDIVYKNVLEQMNIPCFVVTGEGYFAAKEVETLLEFLKVIDNPLEDIPLATAMRSFFGGFSDEELGMIRSISKEKYLYNAVKALAFGNCGSGTGEKDGNVYADKQLSDKCYHMVELIEHFRSESKYMSVYELIREAVDGEYGDYVRSLPEGVRAAANLDMLLTKAADFGKLSYKGLFHFLRYIDQIRKYEIDFGEAGVNDESDDTVRIMTIHKSKGLEFPFVFISGMAKKRNDRDENALVLKDADYGLGLDYVDSSLRVRRSSLLKSYIRNKLSRESLAEEIRILYVAMTRAKEKLIMVGVVKDFAKDFWDRTVILEKSLTYLDILVYTKNTQGELKETDVIEKTIRDLLVSAVGEKIDYEDKLLALKRAFSAGCSLSARSDFDEIVSCLEYKYPYDGKSPAFAKLSVSDLKKKSMEEDDDEDGRVTTQNIHTSDNNAGTYYGTAFHRMLELWDYSISAGNEAGLDESVLGTFFESMNAKGRLEKEQLDAVKMSEILCFLQSDVGIRMGKAATEGNLYREQPFMFGIDAKDVEAIKNCGSDSSLILNIPKDEDMMIVQGIIDAYWIENGEIVILDYKTDRVSDSSELVKRYHVQLDYYEKALLRLTDMPIKEKLIYSARLHQIVEL